MLDVVCLSVHAPFDPSLLFINYLGFLFAFFIPHAITKLLLLHIHNCTRVPLLATTTHHPLCSANCNALSFLGSVPWTMSLSQRGIAPLPLDYILRPRSYHHTNDNPQAELAGAANKSAHYSEELSKPSLVSASRLLSHSDVVEEDIRTWA